ncbi:UDP-N-acetylmuramoyl-L-alanyl-D-glutamate--2,6-diaminopimelate ligase, partial [Desulfovibrio sp. OttesenSCG-928-M14]|nr:UDP-N-acetylmuramoyl-L-alanyl-D-glutamate--2,6-diaminopimelate ligase [Desulfovibrio sp. OttesenSCG-928-M14]
YRWPGHEEDAPLTTPGCLELHDMLARMHKAGVEYAFMEVSSHALDQERVAGIDFSGALLTNITQDHLDYHQDMDEYYDAKARLFLTEAEGGVPFDEKKRVANSDDALGRRILELRPGGLGFGLTGMRAASSRHLAGDIVSMSPQGLRLRMEYEGKSWDLASPLVGAFNAMNLLGAQAMCLELGLCPDDFGALESFAGVSGRLERVPNPLGLNVFVDYAHTPDALSKAISALRDAGFARIITVFGCGGNRDRSKRPLMGRAVAGLTDVAVLTSDNPRDEDPEAIMADVRPGLAGCPEVFSLADRREALARGLALLGKNDALLVAGKGHERYQLVKGVKTPFSDQDVLRELIQ